MQLWLTCDGVYKRCCTSTTSTALTIRSHATHARTHARTHTRTHARTQVGHAHAGYGKIRVPNHHEFEDFRSVRHFSHCTALFMITNMSSRVRGLPKRACVRAFVHAFVRAWVRVCMRACVRAHVVRAHVWIHVHRPALGAAQRPRRF